MANVIHTPAIENGGGRSLPLGNAVEECAATPDANVRTETLDPSYLERLSTERKLALERAEKAEEHLSKLQNELTAIQDKAESEGYEAGLSKARDEAETAKAKRDEELSQLLQSIKEEQVKLIRQAEDAAVEIAFAATTKILGKLKTNSDLLTSMVRQAMNQVLERDGLVIWLASDDCQRMKKVATDGGGQWKGVEFKADDEIELGGCRIDSRCGSLDARLEYQLDQLKKVLTTVGLSTTTEDSGD